MNSVKANMYSRTRMFQDAASRKFLEKLDLKCTDRVLDVCCGSGELTSHMSTKVQSIIGIDVSEDMVRVAKENNQQPNIEYIVLDAQDYDAHHDRFKESFDKVVSFHSLHWVQDALKAVINMYSSLKHGGEVMLMFATENKVIGLRDDGLPAFFKNHPKWKENLKDYKHGFYKHDPDVFLKGLISMGFSVTYFEKRDVTSEVIINNEEELKRYLQTLLGHFGHLPEAVYDDFLNDAVEWCQDNLPFPDGRWRFPTKRLFVVAKKT